MADAVASQTLVDNDRIAVIKLTNVSDGTGESAVLKVDVSALNKNLDGRTCTGVKINKVWASTSGMAVRLLWDATTDVVALTIPQDVLYCMKFNDIGGLVNNAGTGKTGDVLLTTVGHTSGDSYTLVLECAKTYG